MTASRITKIEVVAELSDRKSCLASAALTGRRGCSVVVADWLSRKDHPETAAVMLIDRKGSFVAVAPAVVVVVVAAVHQRGTRRRCSSPSHRYPLLFGEAWNRSRRTGNYRQFVDRTAAAAAVVVADCRTWMIQQLVAAAAVAHQKCPLLWMNESPLEERRN